MKCDEMMRTEIVNERIHELMNAWVNERINAWWKAVSEINEINYNECNPNALRCVYNNSIWYIAIHNHNVS